MLSDVGTVTVAGDGRGVGVGVGRYGGMSPMGVSAWGFRTQPGSPGPQSEWRVGRCSQNPSSQRLASSSRGCKARSEARTAPAPGRARKGKSTLPHRSPEALGRCPAVVGTSAACKTMSGGSRSRILPGEGDVLECGARSSSASPLPTSGKGTGLFLTTRA